MKWLLDTCVLSETIKPHPDKSLLEWFKERRDEELFISTLTAGELRKGIDLLPQGTKKHNLFLWFTKLVSDFSDRFLEIDTETSILWEASALFFFRWAPSSCNRSTHCCNSLKKRVYTCHQKQKGLRKYPCANGQPVG